MRQFLTTLVVVWMAAAIAAYFYSQQLQIPLRIAFAVLPAFLVEIVFYLAPGFAAVRKVFDRLGSKAFRAVLLAGSGILPYLIESLRTGTFELTSFLVLLAVVLFASFLHPPIPPPRPASLFFLAFQASR